MAGALVATATTVSDSRALPVSLAGPTRSPTLNEDEAHLYSKTPAVSTRMPSVAAETPGPTGPPEPVPTDLAAETLRWAATPRNLPTKSVWVCNRLAFQA